MLRSTHIALAVFGLLALAHFHTQAHGVSAFRLGQTIKMEASQLQRQQQQQQGGDLQTQLDQALAELAKVKAELAACKLTQAKASVPTAPSIPTAPSLSSGTKYKDDPKYAKYFTMKKLLPAPAILNKMTMEGVASDDPVRVAITEDSGGEKIVPGSSSSSSSSSAGAAGVMYKDHPTYGKFWKMKKVGVASPNIAKKMIDSGIPASDAALTLILEDNGGDKIVPKSASSSSASSGPPTLSASMFANAKLKAVDRSVPKKGSVTTDDIATKKQGTGMGLSQDDVKNALANLGKTSRGRSSSVTPTRPGSINISDITNLRKSLKPTRSQEQVTDTLSKGAGTSTSSAVGARSTLGLKKTAALPPRTNRNAGVVGGVAGLRRSTSSSGTMDNQLSGIFDKIRKREEGGK